MLFAFARPKSAGQLMIFLLKTFGEVRPAGKSHFKCYFGFTEKSDIYIYFVGICDFLWYNCIIKIKKMQGNLKEPAKNLAFFKGFYDV
jgi:hypothetical protein